MIGLISHVAATPTIYIAPTTLFHIWGIPITNSVLYGWIAAFIIVVGLIFAAKRISVKPKGGVIQYIEVLADFISNTVKDAFEDKEKAQKYILYFVTLFFFLLLNNLLGLIPGVGDPIKYNGAPLLRPFTADFNGTLAVAVITMSLVYIASIKEVGVKNYLGHFFLGSLKNPLYWFIGLTEIITDMTRVISLSLRLFLNVAIVAIIVVVFAWLGHFLAPFTATPFFFLDLFDDVLQAFIFSLLAIMYLAITVNHVSLHAKEHLTEEDAPATMRKKSEVPVRVS